MQKIIYINNDMNGRDVNEDNRTLKKINEMLADGWKTVHLSVANESAEGGIGGFVVLEKD